MAEQPLVRARLWNLVSVSLAVRFWPIAAWMACQGAALWIAAARVPLSARYPAPEEKLAVHVMVVVQTIAAALLIPFLYRTLGGALVAAGLVVPFIQLAAFLASDTNNDRLHDLCVHTGAWVLCAGALTWACSIHKRGWAIAGAVALLLSLGGAVGGYLIREFGQPMNAMQWSSHAAWGPTLGALAILEDAKATGTSRAFLGILFTAAVIYGTVTRLIARTRRGGGLA